MLAQGKGSRLYKKIVDELQLATDLSVNIQEFFDYGIFLIEFQLNDIQDFEPIKQIIAQEIAALIDDGWSELELQRAQKKVEAEFLGLFENTQLLASAIGESYLATGDEQFIVNYLVGEAKDQTNNIKNFLRRYIRPSVMHTGLLLPITQQEQKYFDVLQQKSDEMDNKILSAKQRNMVIEGGRFVEKVVPKNPPPFSYPQAKHAKLSNGLTVLHHHDATLPTIDLVLELKAKYYYEPESLQGLSACVSLLLVEGVKNMSGYELALQLESYGMSLQVEPGAISLSMLKDDLVKGLEFLTAILTQATFTEEAIAKIKEQMLTDLEVFWDDPSEFVYQLARENVYRHHPYSKNIMGTRESIERITREDIISWYTKMLVPGGARIAIVGDISQYDIPHLFEKALDSWRGTEPASLQFSVLQQLHDGNLVKYIQRDQVVLFFAGLSVSRMDADFDKLLLFEQIFSGGVLNSMSSRLFMIREETGLFYSIRGSLLMHADEQPGMIAIKTIVSQDRLAEAIERIKHVIDTAIDTVTQAEFDEAKNAVINSLVDHFSTHQQMGMAFLFQDRFNLPADYFAQRAGSLKAISLKDMVAAVKKYLRSDKLICIKVGRLKD